MSSDHMVTELRCALLDICNLLNLARCPNLDCNKGILMGQAGEGEKCEWCSERKSLIDEHG